jgi:hypothetical protein
LSHAKIATGPKTSHAKIGIGPKEQLFTGHGAGDEREKKIGAGIRSLLVYIYSLDGEGSI